MKKIIQLLLKLLFPTRCGFCGTLLLEGKKYFLCDDCLKSIKFIGKNCCQKCGKSIILKSKLCSDCKTISHHFDRAFSAVEYRDSVKDAIIRYKFFEQKSGRNSLAALALSKALEIDSVDFILPVPLHKDKLLKRGFNQSEEIARFIAKATGVELNTQNLIRIKNTKSQSTLSRQERLKNLKKAFDITNRQQIFKKNLLLVDDVYTTGSTVSECARVLKAAGANKVYVLTIASGRSH